MKEIPILMSTPMVQAIIAGRKTMTRRIVKPQPSMGERFTISNPYKMSNVWTFSGEKDESKIKCPYGQPGDILWVRESCLWLQSHPVGGWIYNADDHSGIDDNLKREGYRWRPSIHMPKGAARIWLEVTDIHIQRLQDITEQDAFAEGVLFNDCEVTGRKYKDYKSDASGYGHPDHDYPEVHTAKESFRTLWTSINGEESWDVNPWVWCVSFRVLSTTGKP